MEISEKTKLYEHEIATFWFDKDGILYSVAKAGPRTIEIMKGFFTFVKEMTNHKKVCVITNISKAYPMDQQTRDYSAMHLQDIYKAMAIVSDTEMGEIIGKVFIQLETQSYPVKMFTKEKAAIEWIKQYL